MDVVPGTEEADRLEVLATLVDAHERAHHAIEAPDPVATILFRMDQAGLSRKDLEPAIGSRARVSEILVRKRPLTLAMIRRLSAGFGIPAEDMVREYETAA